MDYIANSSIHCHLFYAVSVVLIVPFIEPKSYALLAVIPNKVTFQKAWL